LTLDLVNLNWEIQGMGRRKAALVNMTWKKAIQMIVEAHVDGTPAERQRRAHELAEQYFTKNGRAATVQFLQSFGLTEDAIAAQAATLRLPELEILDRQMERARVTRMAITRDIEHQRAAGSWMPPNGVLAIADGGAASTPVEAPTESPKLAP
jgi:hypothetical protein